MDLTEHIWAVRDLLSYSCNSSTAVKRTALCSGSLIFNLPKSSSSRAKGVQIFIAIEQESGHVLLGEK